MELYTLFDFLPKLVVYPYFWQNQVFLDKNVPLKTFITLRRDDPKSEALKTRDSWNFPKVPYD